MEAKSSEIDIERSSDAGGKGVPEKLYKYRSGSDHDIATLKRHKVYVPNLHELNDIYENDYEFELRTALENDNIFFTDIHYNEFGEPVYAGSMVSRGITDQERLAHRERITQQVEAIRSHFFGMGVYSLSEDPLNQQMWGYYADSHKGYCIEYLIPSVRGRLGGVDYYEKPHRIEWALAAHYNPDMLAYHMIGTKHVSWRHEREWRLLMPKGGCEYAIPYEIGSIILGFRSEKVERDLREIFGDCVKFKRVVKLGDFRIGIEDA